MTTFPETKEQLDAVFATMFANTTPADQLRPTVTQLLEKCRSQLEQKRAEGFSLRQICDAIKAEPLSIKASPATLQRFLGGKDKKRRAKKFTLRPIVPLDPPAPRPAAPAR
ncbi:MAG TPA: hypothetical protein VHE61_13935 [Opitutaceae bacterium]|nr:hypothetical protein [Opitutaceae bacterium]